MPGDPSSAIRERLDDPMDIVLCGDPYADALKAVLDVQMPDLEHEHPDDRKALADGWAVCRAAVVDAIAKALGVTERTDHA